MMGQTIIFYSPNSQDEAHTSIESITTAAEATSRALRAARIVNATAEWRAAPTQDDHETTYVRRQNIINLAEVKVSNTQLCKFIPKRLRESRLLDSSSY